MKHRNMKRIRDIKKLKWNRVEVEYFDGAVNGYNYAKRRVYFPNKHSGSGAYIKWFGKKKIVEALYL